MANDLVVAGVTLKSRSGLSIYRPADFRKLSVSTVGQFRPLDGNVDKVRKRLVAAGFKIEATSQVGLSISGPRALFEAEFGTQISKRSRVIQDPRSGTHLVKHFASSQKLLTSKRIADLVEAVQLAVPAVSLHTAVPPTPNPSYYRLSVVNDVPALLNATGLHGTGINGSGIRVSMVDTGFVTRVTERRNASAATTVQVDHQPRAVAGVWLASDAGHQTNYFSGGSFTGTTITLGTPLPSPNAEVEVVYSAIHPHFTAQGWVAGNLRAVAGLDLERDEDGHGTAGAANLLALAPGATFSFVKYTDGTTLNAPLAAFQAAMQYQSPRIIVCSWSTVGFDQGLHLAITDAVANGITVVCAAGNGETDSGELVPISHPAAISVGGAYPIEGGGFRASNYASSYDSALYLDPQRHCPDVVGLVGEQPGAALIMLPTEPGNALDQQAASSVWPNGDNTGPADGWCVISGTSVAAPQVAGVVALLLQRYPALTPAAVKNIIQNSARDITSGSSNSNPVDLARAGWDAATGFGLVDAQAALDYLQAGSFNAFIRDSVEDNGTQPCIADRLWASPDIIVTVEPLASPAEVGDVLKHRFDLSENPELGQTNYIYLRVQNRGAVAGATTATVYVTDPGMFADPSKWTLIGSTAISYLQPGELRVAGPIDWPPALMHQGHHCLIATLNSDLDPAPPLSSIHSSDDFVAMVKTYNNIAWKNVEVVDVLPGSSSSFDFTVEAPAGTAAPPALELDLREFPAGAMALVRVARRPVEGALLTGLEVVSESSLYRTLRHQGGLGSLNGLALKAGERLQVRVTYTLPSQLADRDHVIRARLLVAGANAGGYTYVARSSQASFVGNRHTLELHRRGCPWELRMRPYHRIPFGDMNQAHGRGFDNCAVCLGGSRR